MRRKLLSTATAMIVAIGGVAVAPAKPANAVDVATIIQVYTYVKKAYGYWKDVKGFLDSGGSNGMSVEQATNLIINEIRISRTEIIDTMTNIATADVRACATHHVIEFADIQGFSPVVLQQWAQDATSCVTRIASLYTALPAGSYAARNDLGNALGAVGPIALIARARAGFTTEGLTNVLVQAFERVAQTFVPACYMVPDGYNYSDEQWPSQPIYILTSYHCFAPGYPQVPGAASAYNYAWWQTHVYMNQSCVCGAGSPNYAAVDGRDLYALTNATTSRGIALDALAKLR